MNNQKRRAFVFRGLPLAADSRTIRNGSLFDNVIYCTWERAEEVPVPGCRVAKFPFKKDGGWIFIKYPLLMLYLFFFSLFKVRGSDVCLCMDLDMFVPIWLGSAFKRTKIIFDVVDPASQARFKRIPLSKTIDRIEAFFIKRASLAIFPHEVRLKYYSDRLGVDLHSVNHYIIENMPSFDQMEEAKPDARRNVVVIGYFGTLDSSRGLDIIIDFVSRNVGRVELLIAGDGPLRDSVEKAVSAHGNIFYLGRYTGDQLGSLYSKVDFSWMYYDPEIYLHKYAAPNKFFEHLCYRKPVITNSVIPQAEFILENRTGVIIDSKDSSYMDAGKISDSFLGCLERFSPGLVLYTYWDDECRGYYDRVKEEFEALLREM